MNARTKVMAEGLEVQLSEDARGNLLEYIQCRIAGWNRKDRRTAAWKLKVAEARNKALKAKIEALESELDKYNAA